MGMCCDCGLVHRKLHNILQNLNRPSDSRPYQLFEQLISIDKLHICMVVLEWVSSWLLNTPGLRNDGDRFVIYSIKVGILCTGAHLSRVFQTVSNSRRSWELETYVLTSDPANETTKETIWECAVTVGWYIENGIIYSKKLSTPWTRGLINCFSTRYR